MSPRRTALFCLAFFLVTARGITVADATLHLDVAVGLVTRGSAALSIDPGDLWVEDRPIAGALFYFEDDEIQSALPPGLAILATPTVAIGAGIAHLEGDPEIEERLQPVFHDTAGSLRALLRPINRDPRAIGLTILNPIAGALTVLFALLALQTLGASMSAQRVAVVALIASPVAVYAGTAWTQPIVAAAFSFAMQRALKGGSPWPIGIALAIATLVRLDHAPCVLFFMLAWMTQCRLRVTDRPTWLLDAIAFLAPSVAVIIFLAFWGLPETASGAWSLARLPEGLLGLLISPLSGLAFYAPFAWLAVPGARDRRLAPFLGILAYELVLYGGWQDWDATFAYGPRFLVPALPVIGCLLALAWDRAPRLHVPIALVLVFSAFVTIPGLLVAHVRIEETHRFAQLTFLDAWRTLLLDRTDTIGYGVDCVSTYVPFYGAATLAALGCAVLVDRTRRAS